MTKRFHLRPTGMFSIDVLHDTELIGTLMESGGWFVGRYFDHEGYPHGIDVHAEPLDALRAIVRGARPEETEQYA